MGEKRKRDRKERTDGRKSTDPKEGKPHRGTRLQAFWQMRLGRRMQDVVDLTGAS